MTRLDVEMNLQQVFGAIVKVVEQEEVFVIQFTNLFSLKLLMNMSREVNYQIAAFIEDDKQFYHFQIYKEDFEKLLK